MSMHGAINGTKIEDTIRNFAQAEANGTMMYYALACLAREQGLEEVAETFVDLGNQEAVHAGFYATLSGKYPINFWDFVRSLAKAETNGEAMVKGYADQVRADGLNEAADQMEVFAKQEGHHGVVLTQLLEKYSPVAPDLSGKTVYICKVCGYIHVGNINDEPDTYTCPICGQPKSAFGLKQ